MQFPPLSTRNSIILVRSIKELAAAPAFSAVLVAADGVAMFLAFNKLFDIVHIIIRRFYHGNVLVRGLAVKRPRPFVYLGTEFLQDLKLLALS